MTAHVIRRNNVVRMIKSLPLCCLLLTGYSFAGTGADISGYARVIRDTILIHSGDSLNNYKGKTCTVRIHLAAGGTLLGFDTEGGDPGLCNRLSDVLRTVDHFPVPPSEAVYQAVKDGVLDFKP
ncbi:TPA: energry transducer TonB [Salmonella enterica]|nr:energry transducer TonB [Salmonella enterica]